LGLTIFSLFLFFKNVNFKKGKNMNLLNELRQLNFLIQLKNLQESLKLLEIINYYLNENLESLSYIKMVCNQSSDSEIKKIKLIYNKTFQITKFLSRIHHRNIESNYSNLEIYFFNKSEKLLTNFI
jgi:hypothetical protein